MTARLTVVMPTYRRSLLIGRALASVLRQELEDLVVLVLDNASGDETEAVVGAFARYDKRVQYVRRPHNIGLEANFADGFDRVTTPYVAFLPDDDFLLPGCYRSAVAAMDADPALGFTALRMIYANPDGTYSWEHAMTSGRYEPPHGLLEIVTHRHRSWMGTVFRTECRDAGIRLRPDAGPILDLDFQLQIASRYPVMALDPIGAVYATGPSPTNHARWNVWHARIESRIRQEYGLPPDVAEASAQAFHRRRTADLFSLALAELSVGGSSVSALAQSLASAGAPRRAAVVRRLLRRHRISQPALRVSMGIRGGHRLPRGERLQLAALVSDEQAQLTSLAALVSDFR